MIEKIVLEKRACLFNRGFRGCAFFSLGRSLLFLTFRQGGQETAGSDDHDLGDSLRIFKSQSHGHITRLGVAYERRALDTETVHEHHDEASAIGNRVIARVVGQTKAGLIVSNGAYASGGQRLKVALKNISR